jgi:hypothetical protein
LEEKVDIDTNFVSASHVYLDRTHHTLSIFLSQLVPSKIQKPSRASFHTMKFSAATLGAFLVCTATSSSAFVYVTVIGIARWWWREHCVLLSMGIVDNISFSDGHFPALDVYVFVQTL